MPIQIDTADSSRAIREFVFFPFDLYRDDPLWVPPLLQAEFHLHDRKQHPFHEHAKVEYFLARRGGKIAGRIAAIVNHEHNRRHHDRVGFWGFFDSANDSETTAALFSAAEGFLRAEGMDRSRGPMSFSINEASGLLVDGFDTPPSLMMPHNPAYLPGLVEGAGYRKVMDLLAFYLHKDKSDLKRFARVDDVLKRSGVRLRRIDKAKLDREVRMVNDIFNDAWSDNWGFVPMTEAELGQMAKDLKMIFDPRLSIVVELKGEPIAFALGLPNVNPLIKKIGGRLFPFGWLKLLWGLKSIREVRVPLLGVRKKHQGLGLGTALALKMLETAVGNGYDAAEMSWILETNRTMIVPLKRMAGRVYKTYRVYEKGPA